MEFIKNSIIFIGTATGKNNKSAYRKYMLKKLFFNNLRNKKNPNSSIFQKIGLNCKDEQLFC
ncbi:MAG: hypothetical protein DWQ10_07845 [Calditrichaeota bacterium]|nr:MAG: hypothetical protein DWQ10_07845 [Calditrichota bacterium]